jgi:N-methylhydantoinase A
MPPARSTREVFLDVRRRWQPTRIYHYADLGTGHELSGPAVVEAPTTTVAIPEGCQARVDHLGNLVISYS